MKKKLSLNESLLVGSLLFGLFFGAGNLIFPVELGLKSGSNGILSILGFLVSGVGLAVIGVLASAISRSESLYEMAFPVSRSYSMFLTCCLYLTIGPFFAIPRTATVAFEVGIRAFFGDESIKLYLLIFSVLFFAGTLFFALKPGKIMDVIGKYMTPIFLILLSILIIFSIIKPMGEFGLKTPTDKYMNNPLLVGLIDGYNTMDALAALAFAIIIITNIRKLGIVEPSRIAVETLKSGLICTIGMSVIYASLAYMGSSGASILSGDNGGILLSQMSSHYLGNAGKLLLAAIVTLACFKTAVGLISACSQMFMELFPNSFSYNKYAFIFTLVSFLVANLGLSQIISLSIPVLMFLYPLAISLMILSLLTPVIKKNREIYRWTTGFTIIAAFFDFLNAAPSFIKDSSFVIKLLDIAKLYLPGFKLGFGWIIPSAIGFLIGLLLSKKKRAN